MNLTPLLFFYFITSFGSILGMIATFIQAESTFGSLSHLALALSLRTVVSLLSSLNSPRLYSKFGFKNVLIASEIFGMLALGVLFYGVQTVNFPLAVGALSILAIPSNLLSQGVISIVKLQCGSDQKLFSIYSARINKIMGLMDVAIGLSSPALLFFFDLTSIYVIDLGTYVIGLGVLIYFHKCFEVETPGSEVKREKISFTFWLHKGNLNYLRTLFGTLVLIGMVPLIAGSKDFLSLYQNSIPSIHYINAIWATEGIGFFLSGYIYTNPGFQKKLKPLLYLSIVVILLSAVLGSFVLLIIGCVWVTLSYDVIFKSNRDEALLLAGNNKAKVLETASSFSMMKSLFCTVSPIIIVGAINNTSIIHTLVIILLVQISILVLVSANFGALAFFAPKARSVE